MDDTGTPAKLEDSDEDILTYDFADDVLEAAAGIEQWELRYTSNWTFTCGCSC